jgi:hypothetical protein
VAHHPTNAPYPSPGCPYCEAKAREVGHESVQQYLDQRDKELIAA